MILLHQRLGFILIAVLVVAFLVTIAAVPMERLRPTVRVYLRLSEVVLAAQVVFGLFLVISGRTPHNILHWMYGALTVAALPAAGGFARRSTPRREPYWLIGGALAAVLFAVRAATTG